MYMFNDKGKFYKSYEADDTFPSPLDANLMTTINENTEEGSIFMSNGSFRSAIYEDKIKDLDISQLNKLRIKLCNEPMRV